jgi:hypothetical protein
MEMTIPLSLVLSFVGFFAFWYFVQLLATQLPANIAIYAMGGVILALFFGGPRLYGRNWYWSGFPAGVCVVWMAYSRSAGMEKKALSSQSRQIALLVVMLLLIALVVMLAMDR